MPKRSNLFQRVVAIIHAHMVEGSTVEESVMLIDRSTGDEREVDVVIRSRETGYEIIVGVEATDEGRRASVPWVDEMLGKHRNLPTNQLVLVSASGFSDAARRKAEAEGAVAIAPQDLATDYRESEIVNRLSIQPKTVELSPTRCRVWVVQPGRSKPAWFHAPSGLDVFSEARIMLGDIGGVVKGVMAANKAKIHEQIGLNEISETIEAEFVLRVGPPWTVRVAGEEQHLYLRWHEGDAVAEFHRIEGIEVVGQATITVSEIRLTGQRLGQMTYAYGQGMVGDVSALVVFTETKQGGGKLTIDIPAQHGQTNERSKRIWKDGWRTAAERD